MTQSLSDTTLGTDLEQQFRSGAVQQQTPRPAPLKPPAAASPLLKHIIGLADQALQLAVRILGEGPAGPPPRCPDPTKGPSTAADTATGQAADKYKQLTEYLQTRIVTLQQMDDQVHQATGVVSAERRRALAAIMQIIAALQQRFDQAQATAKNGKLSAAKESELLDDIAAAIRAAFDHLRAALIVNLDVAGANTSGAVPGNEAAGTGGGGGGGIGSILSTVGMLAASGLSLLSQYLPDGNEDKKAGDKKQDEGKNNNTEQTQPQSTSAQPESAQKDNAHQAVPPSGQTNAAPSTGPAAPVPATTPNWDPAPPQQADDKTAGTPAVALPAVPGGKGSPERTKLPEPTHPDATDLGELAPSE